MAIVARSANDMRIEAGAVEFDEFIDHALFAQHLRDGQHQIGRGHAFVQFAGQLETDDFGNQHRHWLAQHRGFGFDAADAPAQNASPLIIVVWLSVPTQVSG